MNLKEYLEKKPLYYENIDYDRMPRTYKRVKELLPLKKVIHVIGTNGKGTTGRFLAEALRNMGFSVGHYTSPHILDFSERIWIDGQNASQETLERAHIELGGILSKEEADSLSYFEYTTLLCAVVFRECDYAVMEAGLGGEHDATAVFDAALTLVTPISYDHEAFLGGTIEEIAVTKLNAVKKSAIIGAQLHEEVYGCAKTVAKEKAVEILRVDEVLQEGDRQKIAEISQKLSLAPYLVQNLSLSVAALVFFGLEYRIEDFRSAPMFGRLTSVAKNVIVDVGHNALAAKSIAEALDGGKYILVYNSFKDKNYAEILSILKPLILHVEIIDIDDKRAACVEEIKNTLNKLGIQYSTFKGVHNSGNYLVFGSFSVVERFLREYNE